MDALAYYHHYYRFISDLIFLFRHFFFEFFFARTCHPYRFAYTFLSHTEYILTLFIAKTMNYTVVKARVDGYPCRIWFVRGLLAGSDSFGKLKRWPLQTSRFVCFKLIRKRNDIKSLIGRWSGRKSPEKWGQKWLSWSLWV